jgi:aminopeptidase N
MFAKCLNLANQFQEMTRMIRVLLTGCFALCFHSFVQAQFTHADTLRGSIGPARAWWNVTNYALDITPDITHKTISGNVVIGFTALTNGSLMQVDLQEPMQIDSIFFFETKGANTKELPNIPIRNITRDGNAFFVQLPFEAIPNTAYALKVYYHGTPRAAKNAPWDGGWIWQQDKKGNPWVSVACQGLGASVWYPCKDHQSDEAENGSCLTITVPSDLVAVGNGKLSSKKEHQNNTTTYTWCVTAPINNYCLVPYIGKYVQVHDTYKGEQGNLDVDYWVLDYNKDSVATHLRPDVTRMLKAFEYWFGPYPFYKDGYKLVDAPHLGMEHQSATAYGNGYKMGYAGRDLSGSGWGLKWDFIIVHESGHEWFANNITTNDIADMWVHEGFTNYSETLFTDYYYGKEAGNAYVQGVRKNVRNDIPIISKYGVNKEGSGDMYYKAGNMLHTIRQLIGNDEKFRKILRGLNKTFYHTTVTTTEVEDYISKQSGINCSKIFDQYLRTTQVPELNYYIKGKQLFFRWQDCVPGFDMPVRIHTAKKHSVLLKPVADTWTSYTLAEVPDGGKRKLVFDKNFFIKLKEGR